ncbi:MAG: carboxypeptidase-like regulatory domain-containing protein [Candidatus Binataceae bacterium]
MGKALFVAVAGLAIFLALVRPGSCSDLTGVVTTKSGLPLKNVKITVTDSKGKVVGTAVTDKNGEYKVSGLSPGIYTFGANGTQAVNAVGIPDAFTGGNDVIAHVGPQGMNANWTMTSNASMVTASQTAADLQIGSSGVSNFFSGMPGPVSASGTNSPSSASANNGPGLPSGPSGMVGGVPVGVTLIPIANRINNPPTPTPPPPPVSPSQ